MRQRPRRAVVILSSVLIFWGPAVGRQVPRSASASAMPGQDADRLTAERLMSEAAELRKQGRQSLAKALEKYQAALLLWEAASDKAREGSTLGLIGQVCTEMGDNKKALEYFERAVAVSHAAGDLRAEGTSLYGIGLAYSFLGESQKALDYFNSALPLRRAANDRFGVALTLNNLGRTYLALARYQEALEALLQTLPIRREIKDTVGEAYTLNAIGSVYYSLGDYHGAIEYYDLAIPLFRAAKNQAIEAYTLNDLGFNYWMLGDAQKALDYYTRALSLWRVVGNRQGEAYTLSNTGMAYNALGDHQKALDYYRQALDLDREVKDRRAEAYTLHNTGDSLAEVGRESEALERYRESLAIKQSIEDRDAEAATLAGIARLERNRGDLAAARKTIESALDIIESLRTRVALQGLRASYFGSKADYYEFYVDLLMRLNKRQPGAGWDIAAFRAADHARARSLLDSLVSARVEIKEGIDAAAADRLRLLEQELEASSNRLTSVLSSPHAEQQATAARQALEAALIENEGFRAALKSQSRRYDGLTKPAPVSLTELRSLLDDETLLLEYSLGKERSYLWVLAPDWMDSFELPGRNIIDTAARRVYELLTARNSRPPGEAAEKRQDRIGRADKELVVAGGRLADIVLGPAAERLGAKRLIIVGDGAFQYVPFGALPARRAVGRSQIVSSNAIAARAGTGLQTKANRPAPNADRPQDYPMLVDHEIVNLPSASVLQSLREEAAGIKPAAKTLAIVADPVFRADDPRVSISRGTGTNSITPPGAGGESRFPSLNSPAVQLGRLHFSRAEAQAIAAFLPDGARSIMMDFAADKSAACGAALGQYSIVHYATHSVVDTEHPEVSGIAMSMVDKQGAPRDGFLRLFDIYNLKLNAGLVVLSACQTALGREMRGEGLMSITRGFMYAGAPRVVSSLWSVDDKATADLMKLFYKGMLVDKLRPAAALRAAQLSMWKQRCCHEQYYWAAFTFQGEWR